MTGDGDSSLNGNPPPLCHLPQRLDDLERDTMDVWNVRRDDPDATLCPECGDPLVREEDIEEGIHFFCAEFNGEEDEDFQPDEGGESG